MKKFLYILLFVPTLLFGEDFSAQFRVGSFFPASHVTRDIYANAAIETEVEAAYYFSDCISLWANFGYYRKQGRSVPLGDRTVLSIYPLSTGLKFFYPITDCLEIYVGAGASYSIFRTKNSIAPIKIHKYGWGGIAKSGLLYHFSDCFFADLYGDYYYSRVSTGDTSLNMGGWRTGVGLGLEF